MAALADLGDLSFPEIWKNTYTIRDEESKDYFIECDALSLALALSMNLLKNMSNVCDKTFIIESRNKTCGTSTFLFRYNRKILQMNSKL